MNRRKFFGMSAAALVAAGLPLSLLPEKKIFLPPPGGMWLAPKIREAACYSINDDSVRLRFDLGWIEPNGEYAQVYYEPFPVSGLEILHDTSLSSDYRSEVIMQKFAQRHREEARIFLTQMMPVGSKPVAPKLPRGYMYAAHV